MEPRNGGSRRTGAIQALWAVEQHLRECGVERSLIRLVQERACQINGHDAGADNHGRLNERERAAVEWAEALMQCADARVLEATSRRVRQHLTEEELINLSLAVVAMNGWNRLGLASRNGHAPAAA